MADGAGGSDQRPGTSGAPAAQVSSGTPLPGIAAPATRMAPGGGAIRGIGETFTMNAATGTGSLSIPVPTTPGRAGFGPSLQLRYDSGAGQGPFGMGWTLDPPAITRKTDKCLPTYGDADEFVLAGNEDLVPVTGADGRPLSRPRHAQGRDYQVVRYQPRVEDGYARIERWSDVTDGRPGPVHWRVTSRDNVTTCYGTDAESRIADPADPARVFSWLICESYDPLGHHMVYRYRVEDSTGVDLSAAHERNRDDPARGANRYLKAIRYGNRTSRLALAQADSTHPWHFEVVFDYGEHDEDAPTPDDAGAWLCRHDPFSSYRAGFEIRTYRLCQRILMFHHFPDEPGVGADCLVRSMRLSYRDGTDTGTPAGNRGEAAGSMLASVTTLGHRRTGPATYRSRSLPPVEFTYSQATVDGQVRRLDPQSLANLPTGLDAEYRWVELDGDGVPGVLSEQDGAWYYRPGLGGGRLGAVRALATQPAGASATGTRTELIDLAGDGLLDVVTLDGPAPGFFERTEEGGWQPHRAFASLPAIDWTDPALHLIDLDGDGRSDVLVTGDDSVLWWPSLGEDGFGPARRVPLPPDERAGPRLVLADDIQSVYLADMTGDGLSDLVRVRNGEICYWPNLGYGRFGRRITMDSPPYVGAPEEFDQRRVRLADHDGSGPTDLIYLAASGVLLYRNLCGNGWSAPVRLPAFPPVDDLSAVSVVDLLGTGTACLVWSSPLPGHTGRQLSYVDLTGGKPRLLTSARNNLGVQRNLHYRPSTEYYLADRMAGRPWVTRLPFPVHVVSKVETLDLLNHNRFATTYSYHHGYYDPVEREFRGFGLVEQDDTEQIGVLGPHDLPTVRTKTWFHTGAYLGRERLSQRFAAEYYQPGVPLLLPDTELPAGWPIADEREGCRALKGAMLRQETYALDGTDREAHPYTTVEHSYTVVRHQPASGRYHGVYAARPEQSVTVSYERRPDDPRIGHEFILETDPYGTVVHSLSIAYGRRQPDLTLPERTRRVQAMPLVTEVRAEVTQLAQATVDDYRVPVAYETRTYQLTGSAVALSTALLDRNAAGELLAATSTMRRTTDIQRAVFLNDDLSGPLPLGQQGTRGLVHESYQLALPAAEVTTSFGTRVDAAALGAAGYVNIDGDWWVPSGTMRFAPAGETDVLSYARDHFFQPRRTVDPFAAAAGLDYGVEVEYDRYDLLPVESVDPAGNRVTAGERTAADVRSSVSLDYRVLAATLVTDPNRNRVAVAFDAFGLVAATAVMGKPEDDTGDRLDGIDPDFSDASLGALWTDPLAEASALLGDATTLQVRDIDAYLRSRDTADPQPVGVAVLSRHRHVADGPGEVSVEFAYSDGAGREMQRKVAAEPTAGGAARWIASGWQVVNNKDLPVRQYEPFFTASHRFEFAVTVGVSPIACYDPIGRQVAVVNPNHTYAKTTFDAWQQRAWDANDTATWPDPAADPDVGAHIRVLSTADYLPTWYEARIHGDRGAREQIAAERTYPHADTPTLVAVDPLGRTVLSSALNRTPGENGPPPVETVHRMHWVLDIDGNRIEMADSPAGTGDRLIVRRRYDLLGRAVLEESLDSGTHRSLVDIAGNPVSEWDAVERRITTSYDRMRRPVAVRLRDGTTEVTLETTAYGESAPDPTMANLRGRAYEVRDQSGLLVHGYDVAGNLAQVDRSIAESYLGTVDWAGPVSLAQEVWTGSIRYDAQGRPVRRDLPDGSQLRYGYDRTGMLTTVTGRLAGDATDTDFVTRVEYNAKGQRTAIAYGNGVSTTFTYDPEMHLLSTMDTSGGVQALRYAYDPSGNVVVVADEAQPTVFAMNTAVPASSDYTYDALYRLVAAAGREHLGLDGGALRPPSPASRTDTPRMNPADRNALGRYVERYRYDLAGNLVELRHTGSSPVSPGWTRTFQYGEPSALEPSRSSNRLSSSTVGSGPPEVFGYDVPGNMTALPPLTLVQWNYRNQLTGSSTQDVSTGVPETTYYVYDSAGQRTRKVTTGPAPSAAEAPVRSERIYLGDVEIYREYGPTGAVTLARSTVHVSDGGNRVALVESRMDGPDERLIRFQLTDHRGSAAVELDESGGLISYEEYYPYGCTALSFARGGTPPKRYRFTGKERDEETGLTYHGARYYAPWLGRWTACDPGGDDGLEHLYHYCGGNPVNLVDADGRGNGRPFNVGSKFQKAKQNLAVKATSMEINRMGRVEVGREVVYDPGSRGDHLSIPAAGKGPATSHETTTMTTDRYRDKGAIDEGKVEERADRKVKQVVKHEKASGLKENLHVWLTGKLTDAEAKQIATVWKTSGKAAGVKVTVRILAKYLNSRSTAKAAMAGLVGLVGFFSTPTWASTPNDAAAEGGEAVAADPGEGESILREALRDILVPDEVQTLAQGAEAALDGDNIVGSHLADLGKVTMLTKYPSMGAVKGLPLLFDPNTKQLFGVEDSALSGRDSNPGDIFELGTMEENPIGLLFLGKRVFESVDGGFRLESDPAGGWKMRIRVGSEYIDVTDVNLLRR